MVWWVSLLNFLLGVIFQIGYLLEVQFLNFMVLWQLLPIYTSWFATQFITRNKEYEDIANRFMNGFSLLWVGFQLGEYIIDNLFSDPFIVAKIVIVSAIFVYSFFIMRLTLLKKDITKYIARIGEVSTVNIAAMLFVQNIIIVRDSIQLIQLIIGFILLYLIVDLSIRKLVEYLYKKVKLPVTEEEEEKPTPRYERITAQPQHPPVQKPSQVPPIRIPPSQAPIRRNPLQKPSVQKNTLEKKRI